ncbi:MAG: NUDIX hydrolase [Smithellaceae bacterium]
MNTIPNDAATVMLLRPCQDKSVKDIEVLLVLRNQQSSFVPGYHVFPGGSIDPEDYQPGVERFIRGIDRKNAARILADMSHPEKALGAWVAGIRETFEEVGMLIARKKDGTPVTIRTPEEHQRFDGYRRLLNNGKMKFFQMLESEDIFLPGDCLHYFSHWITPEVFPLRYDVRFFVTEAPVEQLVAHDGIELTDHVWLRPSAALADYEAGKLGMVLPQIMTLSELSRFRTIAEAIASASDCDIPAHLTKIVHIDGKDVEVMPNGEIFEIRPPVYSWPDEKK